MTDREKILARVESDLEVIESYMSCARNAQDPIAIGAVAALNRIKDFITIMGQGDEN